MRLIADVHGAADKLRVLGGEPGPIFILGDLLNFVDYRTHEGIVADTCGPDFAAALVRLRNAGDVEGARALWDNLSLERQVQIRTGIDVLVEVQYAEVLAALEGVEAYVTYGNADRPDRLRAHLPDSARFVEAGVVEVGDLKVGLVGGGLRLPGGVQVPGELTDDEMGARLDDLGPVDVLCTHVPPAVPPLERDVLGGRQKGSRAVVAYLERHQPAAHYFGDIHQPQATRWTVAGTRCMNVGYFRATGRAVVHPSS